MLVSDTISTLVNVQMHMGFINSILVIVSGCFFFIILIVLFLSEEETFAMKASFSARLK